jgi:hypothetical protein
MRILRESVKRRNAVRPGLVSVRCANHPLRTSTFAKAPVDESDAAALPVQNLQHLIPLALVFEHDLPEETKGWHPVVEQIVMEFLQ